MFFVKSEELGSRRSLEGSQEREIRRFPNYQWSRQEQEQEWKESCMMGNVQGDPVLEIDPKVLIFQPLLLPHLPAVFNLTPSKYTISGIFSVQAHSENGLSVITMCPQSVFDSLDCLMTFNGVQDMESYFNIEHV